MTELWEKVKHGFHLYMDGDAWCSVGPHFNCLADSDAGFGYTKAEAIADLNKQLARQRWWQNKILPTIDKFEVHE